MNNQNNTKGLTVIDYGISVNNPHNIIYHIGNKGYDLIKNRKQQKKYYNCSKCSISYNDEVNAFIGNLTKKHIEKLIKNGFNVYVNKDTSSYKVSISDNIDNIISISVTSTPQQFDYVDKHWVTQYDKEFGTKDVIKNKDYYKKWEPFITKWKGKIKKHLEEEYGIKDTMTIKEYLNLPYLEDWADMDKYVDINILKGNKHQYASYIPHVQFKLKNPLIIKSETVLFK